MLGLIAAGVFRYETRGTTTDFGVNCAPHCAPILKYPNWEGWGLPIACIALGIVLACIMVLKNGTVYQPPELE